MKPESDPERKMIGNPGTILRYGQVERSIYRESPNAAFNIFGCVIVDGSTKEIVWAFIQHCTLAPLIPHIAGKSVLQEHDFCSLSRQEVEQEGTEA